jgi:hypothetical protein
MKNPFCKKYFNLTEQGRMLKEDPAGAERLRTEAAELDRKDERQEKTRTVAEFNELDREGKIRFIEGGGIVE